MSEKITHAGYSIRIEQDEDAESSRDWDNLAKMVCFHKRYSLGDKHDYKSTDYRKWSEIQEAIERDEKVAVILPLYLYDHSGLRIKVGSFQGLLPQGHAEFDSGQVGFVYVTRDAIKKEYGVKKMSKSALAKAEKILRGEVETYDQYLRGDVYGYVLEDSEGEAVDSCWGFFGYDCCLEEAKSDAEHRQKRVKETAEKLALAESSDGAGI